MALTITGSYKVTYQPDKSQPPVIVDFTPPFKRINLIEGLESATGLKFPEDLTTTEANQFLSDLCYKKEIKCGDPRTTARLIDKLVGEYLEAGGYTNTFSYTLPNTLFHLVLKKKASNIFSNTHPYTFAIETGSTFASETIRSFIKIVCVVLTGMLFFFVFGVSLCLSHSRYH